MCVRYGLLFELQAERCYYRLWPTIGLEHLLLAWQGILGYLVRRESSVSRLQAV